MINYSMGATKLGEHYRTLDLFLDILMKDESVLTYKNVALALYFLHDSQADIKLLAECALEASKLRENKG